MSADVVASLTHTGSKHRELAAAIDRCQVIAGQINQFSCLTLVASLNSLVAELPASLRRVEFITLAGVLGHLLARVVRVAGIDDQPEIADGFLRLVYAHSTLDCWRTQWFRVTEACAAILQNDLDLHQHHTIDIRVTRMLQAIHTRYSDPNLTMRTVARMVNLSSSHAARILRRHTRVGFLAHLHQRRVEVARDLLLKTSLSIKEIAATVGFTHASQLSKHFKLICGHTPRACRAMNISRRSHASSVCLDQHPRRN